VAGAERMKIEEIVEDVIVREHSDVLHAAVEAVCAELMEGQVSELVGADLGERRPDDRARDRNGYQPRRWDTRAGEIDLQIPNLRQGNYSRASWNRASAPSRRCRPSCSRRMSAASRPGASISSSKAPRLRISSSEVSRVCGALDEHAEAVRTRPLEGRYPYLFLDARMENVRDGGRVGSVRSSVCGSW
jgi:putative transposase